jgi:hypothetical protein
MPEETSDTTTAAPVAETAQNDLGAGATQTAGTESSTANGAQAGGAAAGTEPAQKGGEPKDGTPPQAQELDVSKLNVPEGFKLEGETLDKFKEIAGKHKFNAEHAQELVDFHTAQVKKVQESVLAEGQKLIESWKAETEKLYKGKNAEEELAFVNKALAGIAVEGLKEELTASGYIHNPKIQAALNKLGREVFSPDTFIKGRASAAPEGKKGDLTKMFK